jgi:hypothetical protein
MNGRGVRGGVCSTGEFASVKTARRPIGKCRGHLPRLPALRLVECGKGEAGHLWDLYYVTPSMMDGLDRGNSRLVIMGGIVTVAYRII